MQTITENETPFVCNMSALNTTEKTQILDLLKILKDNKKEIKELSDSFAFRYEMNSKTFLNVTEFIMLERLCCPFLEFNLKVEKEKGALWLELKGQEGVKDFIKIEFGF